MRVRTVLFITTLLLCHPIVRPQTLTRQFPHPGQSPSAFRGSAEDAAGAAGQSSSSSVSSSARNSAPPIPDAPGIPVARLLDTSPPTDPVRLQYRRMEKHGDVFTLTGDVTIDYKDYILRADKIVFNRATGDAEAEGHVQLQGGERNELILADHGTVNLNRQTGKFYDVTGSVGREAPGVAKKEVYATSNPFIITARELIKNGPQDYEVIDGAVTSCELPDPDWRIFASSILVSNGKARARNGLFDLRKVPVLYLPYVTHPVDTDSRQSGLLIPALGNSSMKGNIVGESVYWAINRSTDATVGLQYFSNYGFSPNAELRYRGDGEDFVSLHFDALFDQRHLPQFADQGGQDLRLKERHDFDPDQHTRIAATAEYLSSYVYREAFAESFSLAVASEVTSSAFLAHQADGYSEGIDFERYQNFEGITQTAAGYLTPQITILHLPSLDFETLDHPVGSSPLQWRLESTVAGLNRSEPNFSSGNVGRFDFYPHLSLPLHFGGWTVLSEVAARDTFYTQSQSPTSTTPVVHHASVDRKDLEASVVLTPPAVMRDFTSHFLEKLLGGDLRHTIEPEITYRYVTGINNFPSIPRFDFTDVSSDTSEVEYSVLQRLFFRPLHPKPCKGVDLPDPINGEIYVPATYAECAGDDSASITWQLAVKHFFDPTFGGAVSPFRRNVLSSTLDFTGVAFLSGPLNNSPLISRLQLRTNKYTDFEWDADYDFHAGRMDASNIFADYFRRDDNLFASVGYSWLQALNPTFTAISSSQVTKYDLLRLLIGHGDPAKPGLSTAATAGYDLDQDALQYGGIQTSYNWDCCGINIEYRRFALGSVRNENLYSVAITLAGVGAAGNLRHSQRIF